MRSDLTTTTPVDAGFPRVPMLDRIYMRSLDFRRRRPEVPAAWTLAEPQLRSIMRLQYRALRLVGTPAGIARQTTIAQQLVAWEYE